MSVRMQKWPVQKLSDLSAAIDYGYTASSTPDPVGPRFLRITDIQNGSVNWDSVPYCKCDPEDLASNRIKAGDIVFARTGATTGKSYLIKDCPSEAVFASYLIRVRPGKKVLPQFLAHFFQTPNYWAQVAKYSTGSAQAGVNSTSLKKLEIPLPPLAEQKRIADILDRADALRAKRRQAVAKLDTLMQSVFLDMFGDPVTNPKGWELKELHEVCETIDGDRGKEYPGAKDLKEHGVLFLSTDNIRKNQFVIEDSNSKFISEDKFQKLSKGKLQHRDIVLTMRGSIGSAAIFEPSGFETAFINAQMLIVRPERHNSSFLHSLYISESFQRSLSRIQSGSAQQQFTVGGIRGLRLIIPPGELQERFALISESFKSTLNLWRTSATHLDNLFQSLQQRAFRGEL